MTLKEAQELLKERENLALNESLTPEQREMEEEKTKVIRQFVDLMLQNEKLIQRAEELGVKL